PARSVSATRCRSPPLRARTSRPSRSPSVARPSRPRNRTTGRTSPPLRSPKHPPAGSRSRSVASGTTARPPPLSQARPTAAPCRSGATSNLCWPSNRVRGTVRPPSPRPIQGWTAAMSAARPCSSRIELTDGARCTLSQVHLLPRPDHPERLDGVRLQGSADGESWQDLTPELEGARAHLWSTLTPLDEDSLGWTSLRLINDAPW